MGPVCRPVTPVPLLHTLQVVLVVVVVVVVVGEYRHQIMSITVYVQYTNDKVLSVKCTSFCDKFIFVPSVSEVSCTLK